MRWGKANRPATEAKRLLQCGIEAARNETPPAATPLAFLRTRVEARLAEQPAKGSIMARAMTHVAGHRKLIVSVAVVTSILLVALLVPFSYTQTVGYNVTFSGLDPATMGSLSNISEAVKALGYENIGMNAQQLGNTVELAITGLPTLGAAREASIAFASLTGTEVEGKIEPIEKPGSGTLYAQAVTALTCENICVDINASLSNEEIEAQIMAKLAADGYSARDVQVRTLDDGRKEVQITIGEGDCAPQGPDCQPPQ